MKDNSESGAHPTPDIEDQQLCDTCGEAPGIAINGKPFCLHCESQFGRAANHVIQEAIPESPAPLVPQTAVQEIHTALQGFFPPPGHGIPVRS